MKRIDRATLRGKPLDEDCKGACTTTNEYGKEDKRVYCWGLYDYCGSWCPRKECLECKAYVFNATPLVKEKDNEEKVHTM